MSEQVVEPSSNKEIPRIILILLPLIGIVLALLVAEVAFRLLVPGKNQRKSWDDRSNVYFMPESSTKMRDRVYNKEKSPGAFRVAVVGDSFTFGPKLQYDDTFPKRLERFLNLNQNSHPLEVMNYGFSGNAMHDHPPIVAKAIEASSDLIILQITLNDAESHVLTKEERDSLFGAKYLSWPIFKYWRSLGYVASRLHNSQTVKAYIKYHAGAFENPETANPFKEGLKQIAAATKKSSTKLVAVIFPMFDFKLDDNYPFAKTHELIHQYLEAESIPYLDLFESYRGIPNERLQVIPGKDSHPNEIAHRIAAEQILLYLKKQNLLPLENIPLRAFQDRRNLMERMKSGWLKQKK